MEHSSTENVTTSLPDSASADTVSREVVRAASLPSRKDLEKMARRRFQRGQLIPASGGPADGFWRGRWREDVITPAGTVKRRRVQVILGSLKEFPSRKLALRALQS